MNAIYITALDLETDHGQKDVWEEQVVLKLLNNNKNELEITYTIFFLFLSFKSLFTVTFNKSSNLKI